MKTFKISLKTCLKIDYFKPSRNIFRNTPETGMEDTEIKSFAKEKITTKDVAKLQDLRSDLQTTLFKAAGILTDPDRTTLLRKLQTADDEKDLKALDQEIVDKIAEVAAKVAPTHSQSIKYVQGESRIRLIEEIKTRKDNLEAYKENFADPEIGTHFSPESIGLYLKQFVELATTNEQERWKQSFKDTELKPRQDLSKKYQTLSQRYKEKMPDEIRFSKLSRHEKDAEIKKWEDMAKFEDMINKSPYFKKIAKKSVTFSLETFEKAQPQLREMMMKNGEKFLKAEADLYDKFMELPDFIKSKYPGFIEMDFEKKETIAGDSEIIIKYGEKLEDAVKNNVISQSTYISFMAWFVEQDKNGRQRGEKDLEAKELVPRINLLINFEKQAIKLGKLGISIDKSKFYKAGFTDRQKIYADLLQQEEKITGMKSTDKSKEKTEAKDFSKEIATIKTQAAMLEGLKQFEAAIHLYEAVLKLDQNEIETQDRLKLLKGKNQTTSVPTNNLNLTSAEIEGMLSETEHTMHDEIEEHTVESLVIDSLFQSFQINRTDIAAIKDRGLNDEEIKMQRELSKDTDGEMVIDRKTKKATKVKTFKQGKMSETKVKGEFHEWRKRAKIMQSDHSRMYEHSDDLKLMDKEAARVLLGTEGKGKNAIETAKLQEKRAEKTINRKQQRTGEALTEADKKAIQKASSKRKVEVRLQQ